MTWPCYSMFYVNIYMCSLKATCCSTSLPKPTLSLSRAAGWHPQNNIPDGNPSYYMSPGVRFVPPLHVHFWLQVRAPMRKCMVARLSISVGGACLGASRPLEKPINPQPFAALLLLFPSEATFSRGASRCPGLALFVRCLVEVCLCCMMPALPLCGWYGSNIIDNIMM